MVKRRVAVVRSALFLGLAALGACAGGGGGDPTSDVPTQVALGFRPPGRAVDLANYTLVAKHDLPVGSGVNALASEASAVAYDRDTDTLFLVGDHGTAIVQVTKTGALVDSMQLPQDPGGPQGTYPRGPRLGLDEACRLL
jgi:hypothetical protein